MAKIMLVEDDKNLSAIYKDRLLAEGYEIVVAHDGEEALALAVKEKPDLIVADVMMPKISGFDMLDILRSTPETKNTKVIMMTALSQAEDQQRAAQLGADKYLVKSQVTLDDVARSVKEVLSDTSVAVPHTESPEPNVDESKTEVAQPVQITEETTPEPANAAQDVAQPEPTKAPVEPQSAPATPEIANLPAETVAEEKREIEEEIEKSAEQLPDEAPANVVVEATDEHHKKQGGERVIQPVDNSSAKPDIMALYQKEMAGESSSATNPVEQTQNQEQQPDKPADPHSISL